MRISLAESHAYCEQLARRTAANFHYSFWSLSVDRYRAMCALYAFLRVTDDLGDDESRPVSARLESLERWEKKLGKVLLNPQCPIEDESESVFPALADVVNRYQIPGRLLFDVCSGIRFDLEGKTIETCEELERYCYQVAGTVGLCCISIWGFQHPERETPVDFRAPLVAAALACGNAFQLTNILRDLKEDAGRERCYIPREDLVRFGCTREDFLLPTLDSRVRALLQFEVARAKAYYSRAEFLFRCLTAEGRRVLSTMIAIYGGILRAIEQRGYDVLKTRVRASRWSKCWCALRGIVHGESWDPIPEIIKEVPVKGNQEHVRTRANNE